MTRRALTILFAMGLFSSPALAEDQTPIYVPTSGWLVGPASLAPGTEDEGRDKLPCIMMNQFDNGYTFRFSAGNKKILAVAVDFRQSAFTAGAHYPLTFDVPPSFSKKADGVAYNDAILMITANDGQEAADWYKAVAGGREVRLGLGKKSVDFALVGAADGLKRVEECYSPSPMKHIADAASDQTSSDDDQKAAPKAEAAPEVPSIDTNPIQSGNASPPIDGLLENAAKEVKRTIPPPERNPAAAAATPVDASPNVAEKWQAPHGSSLRDVLDSWARRKDITVSWTATHQFPVKESISVDGSFEQAVQSLIAQYNGEKIKPVAQLYTNPGDKKQVLVVSEQGG